MAQGASVLRIGVAETVTATRSVVTQRPAERTRGQLEALCSAVGAAFGRSVEPRLVESYPALVAAMGAGGVDLAWLPPVIALRAAETGRARPIALPVRHGLSTFHAALFSREGSRFRTLRDVFGARVAWVDRASAAGYLMVRAALRARGLGFETAFAGESFLGSHDAVARAVHKGEADVGATYLHLSPAGTAWRAGWGDAPVQIIEKVGPIPADLLAVASTLSLDLVHDLQAALLDADSPVQRAARALLEADAFVEVESTHLDPLASILRFVEDAPHRRPSVFPRRKIPAKRIP